MKVDVLLDLSFGSSAKGHVIEDLLKHRKYTSSIRTGATNAGHSLSYKGKMYSVQTIPCAWVDPNVKLFLGAGCFIEKKLLEKEIAMINEAMPEADVRDRLFIDYRATILEQQDIDAENDGAGMNKEMGSTAHGCGAILIRKLWRGHNHEVPHRMENEQEYAKKMGLQVVDTIEMLNKDDEVVLLEGTQGTMLSIHTTPYYPYCTSRECTASGYLSECGFSPFDVRDVIGVIRSFPIRVHGTSGATSGKEMTWEEISQICGREVTPERTTVTKLVRRIFTFGDKDFTHAIRINKPTKLALSFADYLAPDILNKTDMADIDPMSRSILQNFIDKLEADGKAPVFWVGTSPTKAIIRNMEV